MEHAYQTILVCGVTSASANRLKEQSDDDPRSPYTLAVIRHLLRAEPNPNDTSAAACIPVLRGLGSKAME